MWIQIQTNVNTNIKISEGEGSLRLLLVATFLWSKWGGAVHHLRVMSQIQCRNTNKYTNTIYNVEVQTNIQTKQV